MGAGDVKILSQSFAIPSNSNADDFTGHDQDIICRRTVHHRNYTIGDIQCRKPHTFRKLPCLIFSLERQLVLAETHNRHI